MASYKLGGKNMKNLLSNIKEWIKNHRVASAFIALAIIMAAFAIDDSENASKPEQNKNEVAQMETKESKADEKESKPKEVAEETEDVETKVEDVENEDVTPEIDKAETEIEQPKQDGLSEEFADNAVSYLMQLSVSYETLGLLTDAEDEREMMNIIKTAQSDYDETNQYFTNLDPQNDAEQKMYDKLLDIDTLATSALINAEDGLKTNDVDLINQATEDIESSAVIADTIYEDIE